MPELPEVEAICRKLRNDALGARVARCRVLRPGTVKPQKPAFVERSARGRTINGVERRGKHIFLRLSGHRFVHVHLRMTGNLYLIPNARLRSVTTRVLFELQDGRALIFEDPRALGVLRICTPAEVAKVSEDLGPEPLANGFTVEAFSAAAGRSPKPAKLFLLDQRHVAGMGNIYAAEALFRARIHPAKPMNRLRAAKLAALHASIVRVLGEAVESACKAYTGPGRFEASEDFPIQVYGREDEPCFRCGRKIRRMPQGGRSTYYCPGCQR